MQKVKLSDARKVAQITCSLDLSGMIKDDTLYWSGDAWYVRTIDDMEVKVYPKLNKEYVDYQEMVKLIITLRHYRDNDSKQKETEMGGNVFKISDVLKVADVHVDGHRKVFSAYRWNNAWWLDSSNIKLQLSDGNIHWKEGEWVIERLYTHQANIRVTINHGTVKTPEQLFALLLNKDPQEKQMQQSPQGTNQNVSWITTVSDIYMNFTKTKGFVIPTEIPTGAGALSAAPCAVIYPVIDRVIVQSLLGDMRLILDKMMHFNTVVKQHGGAFRCGSDDVKCTIINHGDPMDNSLKIEFVTCQSLSITVPFTYTHGSLYESIN